jgi:hypothetical protein
VLSVSALHLPLQLLGASREDGLSDFVAFDSMDNSHRLRLLAAACDDELGYGSSLSVLLYPSAFFTPLYGGNGAF